MKENLKKLKGYSFKYTVTDEIQLKEPCRLNQSSRDEMFFFTNLDNIMAKVIDIDNQISMFKFRKEKMLYQNLSNTPNVAKCLYAQQIECRKMRYGVILLDKLKKNSTLTQQLLQYKQESEVINFLKHILNFLSEFQNKCLAFLNLSPDNIVTDVNNKQVLINFERVINKGISREDISNNYFVNQLIEESYKYTSPEMLDSFSQQIIDFRSDIFNLGCLLYEICYKKYPYNTPLSVINMSYNIPEKEGEKFPFVNSIIKKCLAYAKNRPKASQLLKEITKYDQKNELKFKDSIKQPKSNENRNVIESNQTIFDQFKNALNKMTKQSESWILHYTEDDDQQPQQKHLVLLLTKVYKNKDKLQKIYQLLIKHTTNRISIKCCIYKTLSLLFNMMRKGPCKDIISTQYKNHLKEVNDTIFKGYININQSTILQMCRINRLKYQFISCYYEIFQGNFNFCKIQNITRINFNVLDALVRYLNEVVTAVERVQGLKYQFAKNSFLDEIYDGTAMLVILFVCTVKDIELKLRKQIDKIGFLENNIDKLLKLIVKLPKSQKVHLPFENNINCYKYAIAFQNFDDVKLTTFEHYLNKNQFMQIIFPLSLTLQYTKPKQQAYNSNKSTQNQNAKTKSNSTFFGQDSDEAQKQQKSQFSKIFESNKQKKQSSPREGPTNKQFELWNKDTIPQIEKKKSVNKIEESKFNFFDEFKQNTNLPKATNNTPKIDFEALWAGSTSSNDQKKKVSFSEFQVLVTSQSKKEIQPLQQDLLQKIIPARSDRKPISDLLDFDQQHIPKKQLSPTTQNINKSLLMDLIKEKSVRDPGLLEVEKQILKDLKEDKLKQLLKDSTLIIKYESIVFKQVIGCGSAGQVYEGLYQGKQIAVKKIKSKLQNPNAFKEFERELITLIKIGKHQNLVSLIGISKKYEEYFLLMDFCEGGNLFDLLHRRVDLSMSWSTRIKIAKQIAEAMNFLHSFTPLIIHRDLKSLNILIQNKYDPNSENIKIKVTDFGLSRNPDAQYMTSALGTLHWMAPQLLQGKNYSLKVDVYSYGVVLWEICCRETPYKQFKSPHSIMKYVAMQNGRPNMNRINFGCPQALKKLMVRCWAVAEQTRPDFKQILLVLDQV